MPTSTPTATNLAIDMPLLLSVQRAYGFKTKKETVNTALQELKRKKAVEELISMMGTVDWDEDYDYKAQRRYGQAKLEKLYESLDI
jgi:Arc/MetJ family transcription regulator